MSSSASDQSSLSSILSRLSLARRRTSQDSARASEGLLLAYCDGNGGDGDDDPEHDTDCEFDDEEAESNDDEEDDEEDEEESEEEGSDEGDSGAIPAVLLRQGRPNSADDAGSSASDEDPSRRASKRL